MFNFLKKKKKKVYDKWFLLIFSTLVVCVGIGSELLKGTSAMDETPANPAFDDVNFYKCIVDRYNYINSVKYDYTYNLSDDELLTISELNCHNFGENDSEKITSIKGVEKLKSLKSLSLSGNLLTEIDVSSNVNLEELHVSNNKLVNLNVEKNVKLSILMADRNELTSLNVSNNLDLEVLSLQDNELTELRIDNNLDLVTLIANSNKLITLDVNKNVKLQRLEIIDNQLETLDVSNNLDLILLAVENNNLNKLDLSNNNKLEKVYSNENSFDKNITLYKGEKIKLDSIENIIKLPSKMSQDVFQWLVFEGDNSDVITLDVDVVSAINGGLGAVCGGIIQKKDDSENDIEYLLSCNMFNVIDISSEEYIINKEENFVYTGNNNLDINKINIVEFSLNISENKLQILNEYENLVTELDILNVDFGTLTVSNKVVKIDNEISYEDFISNITKSDVLSYKVLNGENNVVDTGNIVGGEKIKIYYKELLVDTYEIEYDLVIDEGLIFDNKIIVNEDNGYIKYKEDNVLVEELLKSVTGYDDARIFVSDKDGNEKSEDDLIVTGDTLTVFEGSEKVDEYKIAVRGDANGDGRVSSSDLVQIRKHIVGWINTKTGVKEKKTGIYLYAIDMNDNGNITSSDLVRMRKILVGIDIDE